MADTPVVAEEVKVEEPAKPEEKASVTPVKGPADDIRQIQALLINGIFPGNVAPQIVQAYSLLDKMALEVEKNAKQA